MRNRPFYSPKSGVAFWPYEFFMLIFRIVEIPMHLEVFLQFLYRIKLIMLILKGKLMYCSYKNETKQTFIYEKVS